MIEDVFVVDGVAHSYSLRDENFFDSATKDRFFEFLYDFHKTCQPEEYWMAREDFRNGEDPDMLASAFFAESQTDFVAYHHTPLYGWLKDGGSPLWVGEEMRRRWPHRMVVYGGSAPTRPGAIEALDELIDEHNVNALKFYPADIVDGKLTPIRFDDERVCLPYLEHARSRGIKVIAVHKALPLAPTPVELMMSRDVQVAATAFPDMTFEIVHGGLAFLEETAVELEAYSNIYVNLETTTGLLPTAPLRVLNILGTLLRSGGENRLIWATGCDLAHPRPLLEAFWNLEMPKDLRDGYGFPELTREIKAKILGQNFVEMHGLDLDEIKTAMAKDEFGTRTEFAKPWSAVSRVASEV